MIAYYSILVIISSVLAIFTKYRHPKFYLFSKPLPVIILIVLAFSMHNVVLPYRNAIILGLFFSLIGDMFLLNKKRFFIPGLVSFLLAHLVYILAFFTIPIYHYHPWLIALFTLTGLIVVKYLSSSTGKMLFPVLFYIAAIEVMGWSATERAIMMQSMGGFLTMIGAYSFMVSDTILAINKFKSPFKSAEGLILGTYYFAQLIIVVGISL
ncbi:MAG: lysoplasmalogenase [Candidatus Marinimicrobia bacterium]|nr:lysoplasmalogenase [Candidatus Neomarinimicrobiota bacterium]